MGISRVLRQIQLDGIAKADEIQLYRPMVTDPAYAPPMLETARANIRRTVDVLAAHTGLPQTFLSVVARGDRAFLTRMNEKAFSFRGYDEVMGRLSAAWPDDLPWPRDVPRPAPGDLPPEIREELDRRLVNCAEAKAERIAELQAELARLGAPAVADQAPAHP